MKKQLIGFLLVLMSVQAMAVGHPHNIFSARKKLKAKETAASAAESATKPTWTIFRQVKAGADTGWRMLVIMQRMAR